MAAAHTLFSPLTLGPARLPNRVVLEAAPSGCAAPDGFVGQDLMDFYAARARGGAGLLVLEPAWVAAPAGGAAPHLGLYADAYIPGLRRCVQAIQRAGGAVLVMLDQPLALPKGADAQRWLGETLAMAAWRACAAGALGVMLSTADAGPLQQLLARRDVGPEERADALLSVVETIVGWLGHSFVVGVRLNVDELAPGGVSLHDARVLARRLVSAGVGLIEVVVRGPADVPLAVFPGWCVPLAAVIRSVVEVPIMVGGMLDDPQLADSAIREGSADLIAVGECLRDDPDWPAYARRMLEEES